MHLLPNSNNIKIIKDKSDWNSKNRITTNDILKIILEFHQESNDGNIYHRKISTFANEIKFIQEFGIRTLNEYIDSERIGRSAERIQKKDRFAFWKVYSEYCDMIHHAGFTVDWNGFALYAYDQLLTCPKYDYIIIDEGQDFSVMMIKTLRKLLVNPDKGILFLGDTAQQIYGTKISWAKMGLKSIGSVKRLTKNYRNTNEIIKFAVDITTTKYWNRELSDSVLPEQCGRLGKKPLLIPCNNDKEVLREYLDKHKDTTTCIVVSTNEMAIDIRNVFNAQYITREMSNTLNPNHPVSVATFHAVKGFEFDNIFIYHLNEGALPTQELLDSDEDTAYEIAARLLYVAVTRARNEVVISFNPTKNLSAVFPINTSNCDLAPVKNYRTMTMGTTNEQIPF